MIDNNIKHKAASGVLWTTLQQFCLLAIQFGISIYIARILGPKDYGLVGMVIIFIAISEVFIQSGLMSALVQKKDADSLDYSSVFFFNLLTAFLLYGIIYLSAPFIADFYSAPLLTVILHVLALKLIIGSFSQVQRIILFKNLQFKKLAVINVGGALVSSVVGLSMALSGFGVWSLVWQQIAVEATCLLMCWFKASWYPHFRFSYSRIMYLLSFGSKILMAEVIDAVFKNIYSVVIGKCYNPVNLGYYLRANSLCVIFQNSCSKPLVQTSIPVFSKLQDNNSAMQKSLLKYTKYLLFILLPVMLGMFLVSHSLVEVLLTAKWLPAVDYIKILCIVSIIAPLSSLFVGILKAKRRGGLFLGIELTRKILLVIIVSATFRYGVLMMIYGLVVQSLIAYLLCCYCVKGLIGLKLKSFHVSLLPYLANALIMFTVLYILKDFLDSNLMQLLLLPVFGGIIYAIGAWVLRLDVLKDIYAYSLNIPLINKYTRKFGKRFEWLT